MHGDIYSNYKDTDIQNNYVIMLFTGYTGWPRKNATPTIINFKEIGDEIELVSALMRIIIIFQQNNTKINDFDEGVMILELFFSEAMSISKYASFVSKVTFEVGRNFFE